MSTAVALDNTLGAALIGVVVAAILNGVTIVQASYYFTHQSDPWPVRVLAGVVIALDTFHQALITHTVYTYTVTNWGNSAGLRAVVWSNFVEAFVNGLLIFLVQSFLAMRVWRFSNHNKILACLIALLVVGEFVTITISTASSFHMKTYFNSQNLPVVVNALGVAGDVLIAASLCTLLHRSRTGFRRSDTMINNLMLFIVNTGLLPSVLAIASLTSFVMAKHTFISMAFFFSIGRSYTNCLLVTLNTRNKIRKNGSAVQTAAQDLSLSKARFSNIATMGTQGPANISIKIDTTHELTTDERLDCSGNSETMKVGNLGATVC